MPPPTTARTPTNTSATPTSASPATSASTSFGAHTQTQIPAQTSPSPTISAIAGGVFGGIVGLALVCVGVFTFVRSRRIRKQSATLDSGSQEHSSIPTFLDTNMPESPSTGPNTRPPVVGSGSGNAYGAPFPPESMEISSSAYQFNAISPEMGVAHSNNPYSFVQLATLPSLTATSLQVPSTSNARAEGPSLLYPGNVAASYTTSGGGKNAYQPSARQADEFLVPSPAAPEIQEDGRGGYGYYRSDIEAFSAVGCASPPSYHTRRDQ